MNNFVGPIRSNNIIRSLKWFKNIIKRMFTWFYCPYTCPLILICSLEVPLPVYLDENDNNWCFTLNIFVTILNFEEERTAGRHCPWELLSLWGSSNQYVNDKANIAWFTFTRDKMNWKRFFFYQNIHLIIHLFFKQVKKL